MINYTSGNLLEAEVEALVNTVNTVGVMGKGIALQFRQAFPGNYKVYRKAYERDELQIGKMLVVPTGQFTNPRYIINFPTKRHWRAKSRLDDIEAGLEDLVGVIIDLKIQSIAIPPLGCGFGGLNWKDVRLRIESALGELEQINIQVYEPTGAPAPEKMRVATKKPRMTISRASLIYLIDRYAVPGYKLTLLEAQKLAYFLQVAGEPLELKFVKQKYGPYTETLNHVLQHIEGHYIRGYGDRSSSAAIRLVPGAIAAADSFLSAHPETVSRLDHVSELINGFESPYGMELLSTTHWLALENPEVKESPDAAVEGFKNWSDRKRSHFLPDHIHIAWNRLRDQAWI